MACGFPGITSFFRAINDTVDKISYIANNALCALSNPDAIVEGFLASIVGNINNNIQQLSRFIAGQIQFAVNSYLSPLLQIARTIRQASQTIDCIKSYNSTFAARIDAMTNNIIQTSNCKSVAASIGKCLAGEINKSINKKIARNLNSKLISLDTLTSQVATNIANKNIIGDYANKINQQANNASLKISKFSSGI